MYFVYFLIITSLVCFIPAEIGYAMRNDSYYISSVIIIIVNDTLLNIMCIAVFLYKLHQISIFDKALRCQSYHMVNILDDDENLLDENGYVNKENIDLDFHAQTYHETMSATPTRMNTDANTSSEGPKQMNLINIMIRHTILSVISISFNQSWYFLMIFSSFGVDYGAMSHREHTGVYLMQLCARTAYLMVNVIVLYFNLNINHWIYFGIYKTCHLCCYNCCTRQRELDADKYHRMI